MKMKSLNPFRSPWRIWALIAIPIITPFLLFVLIKMGDSPDLLTRPEPGVVTWNPAQNPDEQKVWICNQLAGYHPTPELEARYNTECK